MKESIENSMEKTLKSELTNLTTDLLETTVDTVLVDGLLKEIPIISILVTSKKIIQNIPNLLLYNKIIKFLLKIKETTKEERNDFIKKINKKSKLLSSIGSFTLEILHKIEDTRKASIIGDIYKMMIKNELTLEYGIRFVYIIEKLFYSDIINFSEIDNINSDRLLVDSISGSGLINSIDLGYSVSAGAFRIEGPAVYEISELGLKFKDIIKNIKNNI